MKSAEHLSRGFSRHKTFIGQVATLMSGKSVAAGIALVTTPIVARLFDPRDFGIAAVYLSIIGIVSNIGALRYEAAIVLPKDDTEGVLLMAFCYRVLIALSVAMGLLLLLQDLLDLQMASLEMLGVWKWWLPVGVFLMTSLQIQEAWLSRKRAFRITAASTVLGTCVNSAIRIGAGTLRGSSVYALITSNLIGMGSRIAFQRLIGVDGLRPRWSRISWQQIRTIGASYSDFPRLSAPATLIFSFGQNLPVLMLGIMFEPAVAGFYAMSNRLSQVPITIVATSVRNVFLQKAAAIANRGASLKKAYILTTGGLLLLGALPFFVMTLYGQPLLEWLLGERWNNAGRYLEIMAPWLLMVWVTAPCNPIFVVLRQQKYWFSLQLTLTAFRLTAFGVAYVIDAGSEWTLEAFVLATVTGHLITIALAYRLIIRSSSSLPPGEQADGDPGNEVAQRIE